VREFSDQSSNWRSDQEADSFLSRNQIPIVSEIDTRALVRHLRTRGVMRGVLSAIERDPRKLVEKAKNIPSMAGLDLASRRFDSNALPLDPWRRCLLAIGPGGVPRPGQVPRGRLRFRNQAQHSAAAGASGLPRHRRAALTSAEDVLALKPDGVFLSNGPGDPEPLRTQL